MDCHSCPALAGGGAPSSAFRGAAGNPGNWNNISGAGFGTHYLRGLDGGLTNTRIVGPEGGSGGGDAIPINTGDYAKLLNDARSVDRILGLDFKFDGLLNGRYYVFTYLVSITTTTEIRRTRVTIAEGVGPTSQTLTGPMPGNQLIEGITHTRHVVDVTNGEMNLYLQSLESNASGWFNGIQLSYVPEPGTFAAGLFGVLMIVRKTVQRRKA
jgi:hypothetical protein